MTHASRRGAWALARVPWQRFWARAPRQLRFTSSGRVLVGLALATGFAAINTGNNLLFLGWALVLSAIVLSGVLSESVIRRLVAGVGPPAPARAGEVAFLRLLLTNQSRRVPAYAIEVGAEVSGPDGEQQVAAPCALRVEPGAGRELKARFVPRARGRHTVTGLRVQTSYPFGFFDKGRRFKSTAELWVMPAAVPLGDLVDSVLAAAGEQQARRPGRGDEFFALKPFRQGDDPRRIAHRRSARTGRWVVRESEATVGGSLILELRLPPHPDDPAGQATIEKAIAGCGSLAEVLLAHGHAVGVLAPGIFIGADTGEGQRWRLLMALARLDARAALPRPAATVPHVVLTPDPSAQSGLAAPRIAS